MAYHRKPSRNHSIFPIETVIIYTIQSCFFVQSCFFIQSNLVNPNQFLIETKPNPNLDEEEQSWKGKQPWKDEQPWKGEDEGDINEQP